MGRAAIGIDIGQKRDPTAVAVVEAKEREDPQTGAMADHYVTRHVERLALGTAYPAVAQRLSAIVENVQTRARPQDRLTPPIWLDATGVGQPVVDLLAEAGLPVTAVYFTHGDRLVENTREGTASVGKALLVSRLQVLLQSRRVHLPRTAEAETLARELLRAINGVSLSILDEARRSNNPTIALKAIDRVQRQIELQAKLLGELDERPQVNVLLAPEWLTEPPATTRRS